MALRKTTSSEWASLYRGTLVLCTWILLAGSAYADPGWLHPRMKQEDCVGVQYPGRCRAEYARQRLGRLKAHFRERFGTVDPEGCDPATLRSSFEARESAWERYAEHHCEFRMQCTGPCGSGHSSAGNNCHASMLLEQVTRLETEMKSDELSLVWGCRVSLLDTTRRLVTARFTVTLTSRCELGFFDCDDIDYHGLNRQTGDSIQLEGGQDLACSWEPFGCEHLGYRFEHGDTHYLISHSGLLRVLRATTGDVLLEEQGNWE